MKAAKTGKTAITPPMVTKSSTIIHISSKTTSLTLKITTSPLKVIIDNVSETSTAAAMTTISALKTTLPIQQLLHSGSITWNNSFDSCDTFIFRSNNYSQYCHCQHHFLKHKKMQTIKNIYSCSFISKTSRIHKMVKHALKILQ